MGCTCRCSYGRAQVFQRIGGGSYASPGALYREMRKKCYLLVSQFLFSYQ